MAFAKSGRLRPEACAVAAGAVNSGANRKDAPVIPILEADRLDVQVPVDNAVDPLSSTPLGRCPGVLRMRALATAYGRGLSSPRRSASM